MKTIKNTIREWLYGHSFPQEYLCMEENSLVAAASLVQETDPSPHIFLGYLPVVIAAKDLAGKLTLIQENKGTSSQLGDISFTRSEKRLNAAPHVQLYTGSTSHLHFLPALKNMVLKMRYRYTNKKKDPVYLPWDIYNQVRLMYAIPRKISVIVVGEEGSYNVCPTDLHGQADENHYLVSLRKTGKLNEQVMQYKKLVLCDTSADLYKEVYALGKNHMKPLKPREDFSILSGEFSNGYQLPLPFQCISYMELEWVEACEIGIHHIHLFKIRDRINISEGKRLIHIHAHYAAYRKSKKYRDAFLIR